MPKWKTKNEEGTVQEGEVMKEQEQSDPQTEEMSNVEELPKETQYELWIDAATTDIFGKAVYFKKTMNEIMNAIADKASEASKVNEE